MLNVLLNIVLFIVKFIGGKLSHSVSVVSDAFNNLTDAATTLFAWLGLKVSSVGAGETHPNGHGRFEWVIALVSSSSVMLVGWQLLTDSVNAIKNPEQTVFGVFTVIVLALSIGIKFFMFLYNKKKSKENDSASLRAVSVDCLSDAVSTAVVLVSLIINAVFAVNIDGWCGILVSVFIMYNGFSSFTETAERIMGHSASKEHLDEIRSLALENPHFKEIDNLQIEDYGYGRFRVSMTTVGKPEISAEQLLADVSNLKYRIYSLYGYHAQITAVNETKPDSMLNSYIKETLDSFSVPLKVLSMRISNAGEYKLAELELGIDFMSNFESEKVTEQLSGKFSAPPGGYKFMTSLRLTRTNDAGNRYRHHRNKRKATD